MEDVACPLVVLIAPLLVDAVEMTHASRQVRMGCFDQQMIVIGHRRQSTSVNTKKGRKPCCLI